jgi:MFS family permease
MMDLALFRDRAYALAIATIGVVFFSIYGMLLLTTQFLQNVRGYPPEMTGLIILPFSGLIAIVSPFIGRLVGKFGVRPLILFGLAMLILGLFGLILGGSGNALVIMGGLALCGLGGALCLTPITTLR